MIEIKPRIGEQIEVKLGDRPELYRITPRQDVTVKTEKTIYRLHKEMQAALKEQDMETALAKMLHTVLLFSDIPLEVLEDLTLAELNQLMECFNQGFPKPEAS